MDHGGHEVAEFLTVNLVFGKKFASLYNLDSIKTNETVLEAKEKERQRNTSEWKKRERKAQNDNHNGKIIKYLIEI